jgi:predicted nucleic-acid-binding protein
VGIAVDTNVLVRYLTWDDEAEAVAAAQAIESAETIVISTIVLCELVWVLRRAYRYAGAEIMDSVRRLVASRNVEVERAAAETGLAIMARGGDFADGVVRYKTARAGCRSLVTFDRDFARLLGPAGVVLLAS